MFKFGRKAAAPEAEIPKPIDHNKVQQELAEEKLNVAHFGTFSSILAKQDPRDYKELTKITRAFSEAQASFLHQQPSKALEHIESVRAVFKAELANSLTYTPSYKVGRLANTQKQKFAPLEQARKDREFAYLQSEERTLAGRLDHIEKGLRDLSNRPDAQTEMLTSVQGKDLRVRVLSYSDDSVRLLDVARNRRCAPLSLDKFLSAISSQVGAGATVRPGKFIIVPSLPIPEISSSDTLPGGSSETKIEHKKP